MEAGAPRPGMPVRGSESGLPVMAVLDLLGRRWAMGNLWELGQAPAGFRELRRRCERMSSSVVRTRLDELSGCRLKPCRSAQPMPRRAFKAISWYGGSGRALSWSGSSASRRVLEVRIDAATRQ